MKILRRCLALAFLFTLAAPDWVRANTGTPTPTLSQPATGQRISNFATLSYTLPVAATPGSVKVTFDKGNGSPTVLTIGNAGEVAGASIMPLLLDSPTSFGVAVAVAGPAITNGTYTVTLSYQSGGNPPSTAVSTGVIVDLIAEPPTLTSPVQGGKSGTPLTIDFTLLEAARPESVKLTFVDYNFNP